MVLLLHAFPMDHRLWQEQSDSLAALGVRVFAPDLPGFAGTSLPDCPPSLSAVAQVVLSTMDAEGVEHAVVAGSSLGGYVSMELLRARPQFVDGLALCGTKATADSDEARANRERMATLVTQSPEACGRLLEQAMLPGLLGSTSFSHRPEVVERVRGWLWEAPADTVAWYQLAMAARPDSLSDLARFDRPVSVVWGEEDTISPRSEQDLILEKLSDGRLCQVDDAGHLACIERPQAVTSAILELVGSVRDLRPS